MHIYKNNEQNRRKETENKTDNENSSEEYCQETMKIETKYLGITILESQCSDSPINQEYKAWTQDLRKDTNK